MGHIFGEEYTAGTWVEKSCPRRVVKEEAELGKDIPITMTRQGNTAFPSVGILKKPPKKRKLKDTW